MSSTRPRLRFGILGTGRIAGVFAGELADSLHCAVVAIGSRSAAAAADFAAPGLPAELRRHPTYEALLENPDVDAVYIATPHPAHARWAVLAAEAGKHILCEKPLTLNHAEATVVVEAARRHDVFLMEAFMYRHHPQVAEVVRLLREGALGEVRVVEAGFGFVSAADPQSRLRAAALGGGAILDVGCYCASFAGLVAVACGIEPAVPDRVVAAGQLDADGVDLVSAATLRYRGGMIAQLASSIECNLANSVVIRGTLGTLSVPAPWLAPRHAQLHLTGADGSVSTIDCRAERGLYALEADAMAVAIAAGAREVAWPGMTPADSLINMGVLDRWRRAIEVEYPSERSADARAPVHQRRLAAREAGIMPHAAIPGVPTPVSRLVLGVDKYPNLQDLSTGLAVLDDFFERGGNAFDTAHLYAGGKCDRLLGDWMRTRGVRDEAVIVAKGAHTPNCTPEGIARELPESLERLGVSFVDVFMLHRDNAAVPVAEFSDALEEQRGAGRLLTLGASNWQTERVAAFNAYAASQGRAGFALLSNNLSLARMIDAPWAGCVTAWDPATRRWLTESGLGLMPWSSQGRGFFTGRAEPGDESDPELVRCWYSDDNFARQARARELATELGTSAVAIALAWVLAQPFPTFPLIGPATVLETADSFTALALSLTPAQVSWLENG